MLMGSVQGELPAVMADDRDQGVESTDEGGGIAAASVSAAVNNTGGDDLKDDEMPVLLHTFTDTIFPDARPMRLFEPTRHGQGADLRKEDYGKAKVGDGIPSMFLSLTLGGTRVTDYGALEDGGVFPTLVGGPSAVPADGQPVTEGAAKSGATAAAEGGGEVITSAAGGTIEVTLGLYSQGRLEAGMDFTDVSVVALPARILAILDVVLACVMGPPAARKAMEMEALEEEVVEEEEEEATGGYGVEVLAPSARWEVLDRVRSAYLYLGRMDARFTIHVDGFALLLPQDTRVVSTNVLMAQVR